MKRLKQSKYGYIALLLLFMELLAIWGRMEIVYALGIWGNAPQSLAYVFAFMYFGGWVAVALAALGLAKDSRRLVAGLALLLGIFSQVACSIVLLAWLH